MIGKPIKVEEMKFEVLVVDDNLENIQVVMNILSQDNYELSYATHGKEALQLVQKHEYDLILLDIMMPEMDGYMVCKELKNALETDEVPIIFLTAKHDKESVVKGFECGGVDYITKPFNSHELLARVRTHLELNYVRKFFKTASLVDSLTGLFNHEYIKERVEIEISRAIRKKRPLGLLMLDIDHFKGINDNFGHQAGDIVLAKCAESFRSILRKEDICGRYGGEEFLVILPDADLENGLASAERIRLAIENLAWEQPALKVTISGGICTLRGKKNAPYLIKEADDLLYKAKENGRNRIESK